MEICTSGQSSYTLFGTLPVTMRASPTATPTGTKFYAKIDVAYTGYYVLMLHRCTKILLWRVLRISGLGASCRGICILDLLLKFRFGVIIMIDTVDKNI